MLMKDATQSRPNHLAHEGNSVSLNQHKMQSMMPEDERNITKQWCSRGRLFTAATHALDISYDKFTKKQSQ